MNKNVVILHRHDVLPSYLHVKIEELGVQHFKINSSYLSGCLFLAFEENSLFKILVNDGGNCALIPTASFMMAVDMVTKQEAIRAEFPRDVMESKEIELPEGFIPPDEKVNRILSRMPNDPYIKLF